MLESIKNLLGLVDNEIKPRKPLAEVLASFNQTISDLQDIVDKHTQEIESNTQIIQNLSDKNDDLGQEMLRAANVSEKIKELIS